jgi:predicted nuclease with RNAse H fold
MTFAGVDVGGRRKGFHAAAVDAADLIAGPERLRTVGAAVEWLEALSPTVIALDSPMTCAPLGASFRVAERDLAKAICGIRWTPEESKLAGNPYYEWIVCGRELYDALGHRRVGCEWNVIEVFPTASWTVWAGRRGKKRRARWTREALEAMNLEGLPSRRLNQDDRDSIAAAITARSYAQGHIQSFGGIAVPAPSAR